MAQLYKLCAKVSFLPRLPRLFAEQIFKVYPSVPSVYSTGIHSSYRCYVCPLQFIMLPYSLFIPQAHFVGAYLFVLTWQYLQIRSEFRSATNISLIKSESCISYKGILSYSVCSVGKGSVQKDSRQKWLKVAFLLSSAMLGYLLSGRYLAGEDGVTEVLAHQGESLQDKFIEVPCSEDYDSHKRFEGIFTS